MLPMLTDEQQMLKDSLERFQRDNPFDKRKALLAKLGADDDPVWSQFAELGWLAATLPEEHGGLGGSNADLALLMEQFGRGLIASPFVPTIALGVTALRVAGNTQQQAAILPAVAEGRAKLALAHLDAPKRPVEARRDGAGFRIAGEKVAVSYGAQAGHLLVSARTSVGISLFLVPRDADGLAIANYRTHDDGWAADIRFDGLRVAADQVVGAVDGGLPAIEAALDTGAACLCAEAVGAMWTLHDMTLDYLKVRKQFGATIGSFQAIQHRIVNVYMKCQLAQSMALSAMAALDLTDAAQRGRGVSAAKVFIGRAARFVGEEAIQLHGGIAMTDEYAAGHYFKRLTMIDMAYGDADHHLRELAKMGGLS